MKFFFTSLSFFLLPLFCASQINTSLDFVGGIDYSYRNMRANKNPNSSDTTIVRIFDETESGKVNFRFGFNFNKRISDKFILKTGLRFTNLGYQRKYEQDELRWGNQQTGGVFNPDNPSEQSAISKFIYNYLFLEVPLIARYEFTPKKLTAFVEFGFAPSLFLRTRHKIVSKEKTQVLDNSNIQNGFSNINLVGVISFGGNYDLNENLQFFAQPTFRYHLTRLYKTGLVKEYLWNAGLEVGLRKRLK